MNWIAQAEAVLDGAIGDTAELLEGRPPPVLDALGRRALATPLLALFMWAAAIFLEQLRGPLDASGLMLRLLALALSVRSALLAAMLIERLRILLAHRRYRLVLGETGILLRTPACDVAIEKRDIVEICAQLVAGRERAPWAEIYVVTQPAGGPPFVRIPPVFASSSDQLVGQLRSWLGTPDARIAEQPEPATLAIPWRRGLPARGPYATMLLGIALVHGVLRAAPSVQRRVGPLVAAVAAACLLLVPAIGLLWLRLRRGARDSQPLVLSRAGLRAERRSGAQQLSWSEITRVDLELHRSWSLLHGARAERRISISPVAGPPVRLEGEDVAFPLEVVSALCEAYRRGTIR